MVVAAPDIKVNSQKSGSKNQKYQQMAFIPKQNTKEAATTFRLQQKSKT